MHPSLICAAFWGCEVFWPTVSLCFGHDAPVNSSCLFRSGLCHTLGGGICPAWGRIDHNGARGAQRSHQGDVHHPPVVEVFDTAVEPNKTSLSCHQFVENADDCMSQGDPAEAGAETSFRWCRFSFQRHEGCVGAGRELAGSFCWKESGWVALPFFSRDGDKSR